MPCTERSKMPFLSTSVLSRKTANHQKLVWYDELTGLGMMHLSLDLKLHCAAQNNHDLIRGVGEIFPSLSRWIGPPCATESSCCSVGGDLLTIGRTCLHSCRSGDGFVAGDCGILSSVVNPSNQGVSMLTREDILSSFYQVLAEAGAQLQRKH